MTIYLRPITHENWIDCIELKPAPDQENFVASNAISLAQAYVEPWWRPYGIYADDLMVGFVMIGRWPEANAPTLDGESVAGLDCILRFMIDARYQGRGYGRAALMAALEEIRKQADVRGIHLSYEPENEVAAKLYASVGFVPTGRMFGGEIEVLLEPDPTPGASPFSHR